PWIGQEAVRQHLAQSHPTDERNDDAHQRSKYGGAAGLSHQLEVSLHSGEQKQQQDAELRDPIDHRLLFGVFWKERVLGVWKQQSEEAPSSRPAINWPMTAGWRSRTMASPSIRPTSMRTTISPMKIASDGPFPPSAAKAGVTVITARAKSQSQ